MKCKQFLIIYVAFSMLFFIVQESRALKILRKQEKLALDLKNLALMHQTYESLNDLKFNTFDDYILDLSNRIKLHKHIYSTGEAVYDR